MNPPIRVTTKQNEYLLQLATGPKTTNALVLSIMISAESVGRMMRKLSSKGLVESAPQKGGKGTGRGRSYTHKLTSPYSELNLTIYNNVNGSPIADEEILYAAILRNGLLLGQRLKAQYLKVFPDQTPAAIDNIITTAKKRGLCR